jgi:hypothetical protein
MLPSTIRLSFRKAWSQRLTSSFDSRPLLQQRFPQAQAHPQPQARQVHEKARPDSNEDEIPPSSAEENNTFYKLFGAFFFLQFVVIGSDHYSTRQNTKWFKQTIDLRDHEIRYLRDKVAELQLKAKEPHARRLER